MPKPPFDAPKPPPPPPPPGKKALQQPPTRLTSEQIQRAINEAVYIDASPHEWPKEDQIPLLCNAILDQTNMIDRLLSENRALQMQRTVVLPDIAKDCAAELAKSNVSEWRMKAELLDWVQQQIGNIYEGIATVKLSLDDATHSYTVSIGNRSTVGYGPNLTQALQKAREEEA
jgi:hypothetical protein